MLAGRIAAGLALVLMVLIALLLAQDSRSRQRDSNYQSQQSQAPRTNEGKADPLKDGLAQHRDQDTDSGTKKQPDGYSKETSGWWDWLYKILHDHDKVWVALGTIVIAVFTVVLSVATVLLAISTKRLWGAGERQIAIAGQSAEAAQKAADIAKQTLVASQRPWVSANPRIASSLVFKDGEGRVKIDVMLRNVGASPALDVEVEVDIHPLPFGIDELRAMSDRIRARPRRKTFAHTIFPNDPLTYSVSQPIPREAIAQALKKAQLPDDTPIAPVVLVCVSYYSPIGEGQRQTGQLAQLAYVDDDGRENLGLATGDGEIPQARLKLVRTFFSGFAD